MKKTTLAIAGATAIALATASIAQELAQNTQKPAQSTPKTEQQPTRQIRYADPNNCDFSDLTDEEIMFMGLAPHDRTKPRYINLRFFNNPKSVKNEIKRHKQSGLSEKIKNTKNAKVVLVFSCCKKVIFADTRRFTDNNEIEKYYMELLSQHKSCPKATPKKYFLNHEELKNLVRSDLKKHSDQWQGCNEKLIKTKESIVQKIIEESKKLSEQKKREQQPAPEPTEKSTITEPIEEDTNHTTY